MTEKSSATPAGAAAVKRAKGSSHDPGRNLALLWGPQDRPGRSGLTVRAIVDAAIVLADADGIDAVSMRGIAERLGAGTMSLYTHVPGKPVLIELMIDAVAGQVYADVHEPSAQPGSWREALSFIARRNWDWYLRHPWLLQVLTGRPVLGPNINRKYEAELGPLDGIGLTDIEMDSVLTLVLVHVEGLARWQVSLMQVRAQSGESDNDWWTNLEPALATLMDRSGFPLGSRVGQAAGEYHQSAGDPAHALEFGIERILDGVSALIDRSGSHDDRWRGTLIAMTTIAILGAGKIGEAMLAGLLAAGRSPDSLMFTERYPDRVAELTSRYGVQGVETDEAAKLADVLIVAVKPQDIEPLLVSLAGAITPGTLVVSLCAGLPTSLYERHLPAGTPVVRVMPNTPMLVGEAMSAISAGSHAGPEHLQLVQDLLSTVGKVVRVPESQQDAVTALSGSGPAYFFFLVEAMIDAGILLGLPRVVSADLIIQSAVGAAIMLRDSGEHPTLLREAVTSPGGTTIAAIRELENHGVRAALLSAIEAAAVRSAELGRAHDGN